LKVAAVDYGRRRVGLAVCDPLGISVRGLPTVESGGSGDDSVERVAKTLREEGVERIVVGVALREDGSETERSREARAFGARLGEATGCAVDFHDEGLTTWAAEEDLKASGKRLRKARGSGEVDRAAAVAILRSYLRETGAR
jgi:putative Holliday junction resolvase